MEDVTPSLVFPGTHFKSFPKQSAELPDGREQLDAGRRE